MSQAKGNVPSHIKKKQFQHPAENHPIILILSELEEPRKPSCNFRHSLVSIVFMTLMGVICGAKDWEEIVQAAEGIRDWIAKYVDISEGIPSEFTLKRVMRLIPTKSLDSLLQNVRAEAARLAQDVIAIDGKTLRGSRGWNENDRPLHLLHAWSTELGVCLGQVSVDEKSNEITVFPELVESLEVKGAVITADALNTQKKNVEVIINSGADYVLPLKANHKDFYNDIRLLFQDADQRKFSGVDAASDHSLEKSAGRVEERRYELLDAEDLLTAKEWKGCSSVGRVTRRRTKKGKTTEEVCYYITSVGFDIEKFARAVRKHWGVENNLHLSLDVIFQEDKHRYQDKVGAANLSLLRKVGLSILTKDLSLKCGRAAKQMRAATSATYRDHLIKNCF